LVLYQVVGTFAIGEQLKVDGQDISRTITNVRDYNLGDIRQVVGYVGTTTTFTADTVISTHNSYCPTRY